MNSLSTTTDRFNEVQEVRNEFLTRWLIDRFIIGPLFLDQVEAALNFGDSPLCPAPAVQRRGPQDDK